MLCFLLLVVLVDHTYGAWNLAQHLATKSPYFSPDPSPHQPKREHKAKDSCEVNYIQVLARYAQSNHTVRFLIFIRHGARNPTEGVVNGLAKLQEVILQNQQAINGTVYRWMIHWKSPFTADTAGTNKIFHKIKWEHILKFAFLN